MTFKRDYRSFDFILAFFVLALMSFGVVMVGSALHIDTEPAGRMFRMHIVWAATGYCIMLLVAFVDFAFVCRFYIVLFAVNILLLILVLALGTETNNTTRWLYLTDIGIPVEDFGIQPSEFTKIFIIVYLAKLIDRFQDKVNHPLYLGLFILVGAVPVVLIMLQPSLSAAIAVAMIVVVMLFTAKVSWKLIAIVLLLLVPFLLFVLYDLNNEPQLFLHRLMNENQQHRIRVFIDPAVDPDRWYQSQQSIEAIRSGQLTGRGLFNNIVPVPYATNDFIFAVVGAEFGFAGCVAVLAAMFVVVLRCFMIAHRSEVFLGKLIAAGVGGMIAFQTILNVSVATGTLPNTGITLPFISSGGSSIWITMASVGLVLSVGMTRTKSMFED